MTVTRCFAFQSTFRSVYVVPMRRSYTGVGSREMMRHFLLLSSVNRNVKSSRQYRSRQFRVYQKFETCPTSSTDSQSRLGGSAASVAVVHEPNSNIANSGHIRLMGIPQ